MLASDDVGVAGHRRRVGRLLDEAGDLALRRRPPSRRRRWPRRAAPRCSRPCSRRRCSTWSRQHQRVVHLVDVVAGQHDDVLGLRALDDVQVLVHRVGGAAVPVLLVDALLRRQQIDRSRSARRAGSSSRAAGGAAASAILYCVTTPMRRMPELTQLDSAKSMMRNLPPKYTAGLARLSVSCFRREPRPPASTSATVRRTSWCGLHARRRRVLRSMVVVSLGLIQPPRTFCDSGRHTGMRAHPLRWCFPFSSLSRSSPWV